VFLKREEKLVKLFVFFFNKKSLKYFFVCPQLSVEKRFEMVVWRPGAGRPLTRQLTRSWSPSTTSSSALEVWLNRGASDWSSWSLQS
jgi:hypothetical protein